MESMQLALDLSGMHLIQTETVQATCGKTVAMYGKHLIKTVATCGMHLIKTIQATCGIKKGEK